MFESLKPDPRWNGNLVQSRPPATAAWSSLCCYISATMHVCWTYEYVKWEEIKRDTFSCTVRKVEVREKYILQVQLTLCVELTPAKTDHKYFINTNYLKKQSWRKEQLFQSIMRLLSQREEEDDSSLSSLTLKGEPSVMLRSLNNVSLHLHVRDERPQMSFEWNPRRS